MINYIFLIIGLFLQIAVSAQEHILLPVFDKQKSYPEKKVDFIREIRESEYYIPLETKPEVLVDRDGHLDYISDKRILVSNRKLGDIFIFDRNGKILFYFNRKGGDAYFEISFVAYDEKKEEVFILSHHSRKIFVYTENGIFKRMLRFPSDYIWFTEIYNFDENTLLAVHDSQDMHNSPVIDSRVKNPYIFISKEDGSITSSLNITTQKALVDRFTVETGPNEAQTFMIASAGVGNTKFGDEFVLANRSVDTVYLLKKDKTLIPLFVQTPSVFSEHPEIISIGMKTDDYIFFSVKSWDLLKEKENFNKGQKSHRGSKPYIYDIKNQQFFKSMVPLGPYKLDAPENTYAGMTYADVFLRMVKAGWQTGNAKQIAGKIHEEDNPIVNITKMK